MADGRRTHPNEAATTAAAAEHTWRIRSGEIDELVRAPDQIAAWDTLRDRPLEAFGVVASAEPDESADPIYVRTSALMFRWGRDNDARVIIRMAVDLVGLPDTTVADQEFARTHG
jgi:hypothetical protein